MRYSVEEGRLSGKYFILDHLREQFVWSTLNKEAADTMAADMQEIHDASPAAARVPDEVVQRLRIRMAMDGLNAVQHMKAADRFLDTGRPNLASDAQREVEDLRNHVDDVRLLFTVLGIPLSV